jgi:hypothetical protein
MSEDNLKIVEYNEMYEDVVNPEIQEVYNSIPFSEFNVVFLKGFSKGINWPFSETAERSRIEGVKNVDQNTQINGRFLSIFMINISKKCKNGEKFVFIYDGDDIGDNYTYAITTIMVDEIIAPNSFFIAYRSNVEKNAFKFSWGSFVRGKKVKVNLICAPEVIKDKYEATGIYSYKKTAECINNVPSRPQPKYFFYNFGGGPILDKEFSEPLPFTASMTFYNVTRIKDGKTERNSIFNPHNLNDIPKSSPTPIQIVVNKGEIPVTIMMKNMLRVEPPGEVMKAVKTEKPTEIEKPVKIQKPKLAPKIVFEFTSDERFKFTISSNGKTTTFRDVFTKLEKNSSQVLKALGKRLEIKGYYNMKKEDLVKACTSIISFKKTNNTKDEKIVSIRKSREKNRIPRNSKKGRSIAKKPMCNYSGEIGPCPKSVLIARAKRQKAYRLKKAGIKPKRSPRKSKRPPRKSKRAPRKSKRAPRK